MTPRQQKKQEMAQANQRRIGVMLARLEALGVTQGHHIWCDTRELSAEINVNFPMDFMERLLTLAEGKQQ